VAEDGAWTRRIRTSVGVIVLSQYAEPHYVKRGLMRRRVICARGYLLKGTAFNHYFSTQDSARRCTESSRWGMCWTRSVGRGPASLQPSSAETAHPD